MERLDFNLGWSFHKDGSDAVVAVDLPHDAMIYEERSKEAPTAGASAYFYGGKYFYEKELPAELADKHVLLECEGVYMNAHVLLNGEELYFRPYGYTQFYVDLTGKIRAGGPNKLTIIADNSHNPNSRWYSGSGIYREVSLHASGDEFIEPEGVKVLAGADGTAKVTVKGSWKEGTTPVVEILDGETVVASGEGAEVTLQVANAKTWDAESPNLYACRVKLMSGGKAVDEACVSFGFRTITWDARGLMINGREVLLRGACIHHDNGILGAAAFRDAEWRRVRILKEAGFNAIRSAHNPISKAMLDACDALGMYVMDENFDMWFIKKNPGDYGGDTFRQWWKTDTEAMVSKDYDHPSVILYSIGNEISDLGNDEGEAMCHEMADFVRGLDDSRAVTLGINLMLADMVAKGKGMYGTDKDGNEKKTGSQSMDSAPTSAAFNALMNRMGTFMDLAANGKGPDKVVEKVSRYLDMPGYNYATSRYEKEAKRYPDRAFVGSETLPQFLYKNWQKVKSIPNLTGDFMWTGWDYLGESGIGTVQYMDKRTKEPVEPGLIVSGGCGVIDITGLMRPEVGWNKAIWDLTDVPTISVDPLTHADDFRKLSMWRNVDTIESWSWPGCEGKKTNVSVYCNGDKAELILNGRSLGKKPVKACKVLFKGVAYEAGTLEAVSYDATGRELGRSALTTATGKTCICLEPEKTEIRANGQDLSYVNVYLKGEDGVRISSADMPLTAQVEGVGTLQAFGSARPAMAENFFSDTHTPFYGRAQIILRAGTEAGEIKLTVSGGNLEPQTVTVKVVAE